jgi:hypothetical protein
VEAEVDREAAAVEVAAPVPWEAVEAVAALVSALRRAAEEVSPAAAYRRVPAE